MKKHRVILAPEFVDDLFDLYHYVALRDGRDRARDLVGRLEQSARSLQSFPDRGHALPELAGFGFQDIQEITNGPYRVIFKILDQTVLVLACIDGRRDVEQVLIRRFLKLSIKI